MLSPIDPLFTLQTPAKSSGSSSSPSSDGSAVTGVCFVRDPMPRSGVAVQSYNDDDDDTSDDDTDSEVDDDGCPSSMKFRCSDILLGPQHCEESYSSMAAATQSSASSYGNLQGCTLASCHYDGSCKIWDLSSRGCVVDDINHRSGEKGRKFGLAVRRLDRGGAVNGANESSHRFLYQTRDVCGTVTLHDLHDDPSIELMTIETNSTTFCTMSPCRVGRTNVDLLERPNAGTDTTSTILAGERNLLALPTEFHSMAIVRDLRCDPSTQPAFQIDIAKDNNSTANRCNYYGRDNKYGMLMSLALSMQHDTHRLVLGCGMEDGSVLFYDLGEGGKGRRPWRIKDTSFDNNGSIYPNSNLEAHEGTSVDIIGSDDEACTDDVSKYVYNAKLGKEPVLSLDLATSYSENTRHSSKSLSSLVAVAGCAGDSDELSDLPEEERGTVCTLKVALANHIGFNPNMTASIRKRTQTCSYSSEGKVGVSITRFRPDGRIFAVGGWDRRLRIFGRTSSKPLAVLHGGHSDSVVAMDWAEDSAVSGLLATGAGDGKICVYRVFPHTLQDIHK
ncbi:hypothetical protein HJC23_003609 [Cyclotella cryptica]|uniref:Uncharacterized protein n=1 Tax=Cyclotella cryptica TaxID=29204 RepID=A0ABD3QIK9_9STRA|eukprot:CCRYP_004901-RA/>CCRYP_004901-RA protein AED:0.37 eAED:0.37 QI:0/-1/0/1/-1/1/1/0/559